MLSLDELPEEIPRSDDEFPQQPSTSLAASLASSSFSPFGVLSPATVHSHLQASTSAFVHLVQEILWASPAELHSAGFLSGEQLASNAVWEQWLCCLATALTPLQWQSYWTHYVSAFGAAALPTHLLSFFQPPLWDNERQEAYGEWEKRKGEKGKKDARSGTNNRASGWEWGSHAGSCLGTESQLPPSSLSASSSARPRRLLPSRAWATRRRHRPPLPLAPSTPPTPSTRVRSSSSLLVHSCLLAFHFRASSTARTPRLSFHRGPRPTSKHDESASFLPSRPPSIFSSPTIASRGTCLVAFYRLPPLICIHAALFSSTSTRPSPRSSAFIPVLLFFFLLLLHPHPRRCLCARLVNGLRGPRLEWRRVPRDSSILLCLLLPSPSPVFSRKSPLLVPVPSSAKGVQGSEAVHGLE